MITLTTLLVINDCVTLLWFNISVPVPRPYIHSFVELLKKDKQFELFNGCVVVTDMTHYDVMCRMLSCLVLLDTPYIPVRMKVVIICY